MPRIRSVNAVTISGRLLSAPELRYTSRSLAILDFRIGARPYKAGTGLEWADPPGGPTRPALRQLMRSGAFFEVVAVGDLAETGAEHLVTGSFVTVTGRLALERWEYWRWEGSRVKILAKRIEPLGQDRELPLPALPKYAAEILEPALRLFRDCVKRMSAADAAAFLDAAVNPFIRIYNRNRRRFNGPQSKLWGPE